jgi:hypothetical protein
MKRSYHEFCAVDDAYLHRHRLADDLTALIAFILGDLCRYPTMGWGKMACFPGKASKISAT